MRDRIHAASARSPCAARVSARSNHGYSRCFTYVRFSRALPFSTGDSDIPAYKSIAVVDVVFQPGAHAPQMVMDNDMVCTITSGAFTIKKADKEFKLKEGDMYTCAKGKTDEATNTSKEVGVHRIAVLIPA